MLGYVASWNEAGGRMWELYDKYPDIFNGFLTKWATILAPDSAQWWMRWFGDRGARMADKNASLIQLRDEMRQTYDVRPTEWQEQLTAMLAEAIQRTKVVDQTAQQAQIKVQQDPTISMDQAVNEAVKDLKIETVVAKAAPQIASNIQSQLATGAIVPAQIPQVIEEETEEVVRQEAGGIPSWLTTVLIGGAAFGIILLVIPDKNKKNRKRRR